MRFLIVLFITIFQCYFFYEKDTIHKSTIPKHEKSQTKLYLKCLTFKKFEMFARRSAVTNP